MIVIDASMAASIVLPDEANPPLPVRERLYAGPVIAPAHWPTEIGNTLLVAQRGRRIERTDWVEAIARLERLAVEVVPVEARRLWVEVMALADACALTFYDAAYLALATRRLAALASNDRDLINAARSRGVEVLTALP